MSLNENVKFSQLPLENQKKIIAEILDKARHDVDFRVKLETEPKLILEKEFNIDFVDPYLLMSAVCSYDRD